MPNSSGDLALRTEPELVERARRGCPQAFTELIRRSRPRLRRAALAILGDPDAAEDAVQNACWKAFEHLGSFRGDSRFHTWLTSILTNQARMRRREARRGKLVSIDDGAEESAAAVRRLAAAGPDPEAAFAEEELARLLRREIRRLPAQFRQILMLHIDDLSIFDAAARLELTPAAVKTRLYRARTMLLGRMRRYAEPAEAA